MSSDRNSSAAKLVDNRVAIGLQQAVVVSGVTTIKSMDAFRLLKIMRKILDMDWNTKTKQHI
jgi:hypothetical protein